MPRKVSDKVLAILNDLYTREIGAVGIYMDQHIKTANHYPKFSKRLEEDAKEEMKHAESLAERMNYLGRDVGYEKHAVPRQSGVDIAAFLRQSIEMENDAVERYNTGIKICLEDGDSGSRLLLEKILLEEENHLHESEVALELYEKFGDQYLVTHFM